MNSAIRIQKLLEQMVIHNKKYDNTNNKGTSFEIFENIFNVKGCINVAQKLKIVRIQINKLKEHGHESTIKYLDNLFDDKNMNRSLYTYIKAADNHIIALHPMGKLLPVEKIDNKLITEISEIILKIEEKLENSDMSEDYKSILNSYIEELRQGILDIDVGGIDGLLFHVEVANGKVATYTNVFKEDKDIFNDVNNIYKHITEILNNAQIWSGAIGYGMGLLTNQ